MSVWYWNPGDRYLFLLANTANIGQYSLPLACYNGQTPIACAIPADLRPLLDEFKRWEPPTTVRSAIVDWHGAVGPGKQYSVWFSEDEEGAETMLSTCCHAVVQTQSGDRSKASNL